MSGTMLFGECLSQVVRLSDHDIDEIMEHQAETRRKFGEIALSWGLCRPHHIWRAWWNQLSGRTPTVDLTKIGIDAQAIDHVPADIAAQFRAVPARCFGNQLVVATTEQMLARARAELPGLVNKQVQFVIAPPAQIDEALAAYYPRTSRAA